MMISLMNTHANTHRAHRSRHKQIDSYWQILSSTKFLLLYVVILHQLPSAIECLREPKPHDANNPCHTGWAFFEHKCYKITYSPRNHEIAKLRCQDLSARLAYVDDDSSKLEEEPTPTSPAANSSVFTFLTSLMRPNDNVTHMRIFHLNISSELLKQYQARVQQELASSRVGAGNGDLTEQVDVDSPMSELWIPSDERNLANIRFNASHAPANASPAFAMAFSRQYNRWGLLPVSPSRKAGSICELTAPGGHTSRASGAGDFQHSRHEHQQTPDTKKASDVTSDPKQPVADKSDNSRKSPEKEAGGSNGPATQAQQPELVTSALFREFPHNQSVVLGSTTELRCSAIESDSSLTWTFNARNLTQSNRVKVGPNGWLRIEHVRNSDDGNYTCTIQSAGLVESRTARLEIVERPHQPEYITAELLDKLSTSVRIRWTPGFNGNSPITKYLVEMRTLQSDNLESELTNSAASGPWELAKANISADQTSVIIADLKPARKYIFRIKAINRVGMGDPSLPTQKAIEVPVQPPSMAPENLTGTPRSSTSISVQWAPPPADSQNGLIRGYKIRHKLAGYASDTDWYTNEVSETSHLNFVLDDLITWQNYEIQVAAENDKGVGPYSSSIFVRTKEGKPDKGPRNVQAEAVGSNAVKVNWNPPPPQHIYGVNQGYKVQVWLDSQHKQLAKETVVGHNSLTPLQTSTIDGLLPYTEYFITVRCFTGAGDGLPQEDEVRVKTKQDLPEAVGSLEFADVLDKSLRLIWTPPRRVNGELSHYTLEYSETSSTDKKILKKFPASINEAKIVDLTPQTAYTFRIFSHTDVGQGPGKTNQTTTSVPPVLPEPPSNLVPINIGPYSATIQFETGFDGNAAIDRWIVEAITPSNGDYKPRWQNIYVSTNHTQTNSVVVRNLRPFTRYKIRLTPSNVVGTSRYPSEPTVEFQTSQIEPEQAPRDLAIEDVRSNSAVAHWSPLSNNLWLGQAKGYNLTWSESNNSTSMYQIINDTRADSFIVRDLEEFAEYTFKIYALNEAGSSPPSEPVVITTQEDTPSASPSNVTATAQNSTSISVSWGQVPKRHRNGIIRGYKIQYQAVKPDAPLLHRTIEDNSTKHVTLTDLKPFTMYHLAVAAFTSLGDGVYSPVTSVQTLEDTPGLPQNLSSPTVSQTSARVLWDPPEDPNGDVLGYKVTYHSLTDGSKEVASHELHHNERTFKATNLKPDTHYVFTVTAKTKEGWGQQASMLLYTYDSELRANLPFFRESWFVISCACLSVVITIIVTALLFVQTKSYKYKQNAVMSTSQDRLGDAGFTIDEEALTSHYNNGFGLLSNDANHRRSNGALSQSTANFTLPKTPPRPHPGSAVYSDDDNDDEGDDDVFEDPVDKPPVRSLAGSSSGMTNNIGAAGTSHYDSSGDSLTEKPSEISSSPAPESPESNDDEYVNMANRHFVNHYANVNGTLKSQRSWKRGQPGASSIKHYGVANGRLTKPKLPHRQAPSVPQVPLTNGESSNGGGQSSSDTASTQPVPGTSGVQSSSSNQSRSVNPISSIYGESSSPNHHMVTGTHHHSQQPQANLRNDPLIYSNGTTVVDGSSSNHAKTKGHHAQNNQQTDLLNTNHMINLNGGRIIVNNMAGSRAPLPGFTSFV